MSVYFPMFSGAKVDEMALALTDSFFGDLHLLGSAVYGLSDPVIGTAAAKVSAHSRVDIGVRRAGVGFEQCRRRHDLPRLAVTALWHLFLYPGFLDNVHLALPDALDRGDLIIFPDTGNRCLARARRLTVQVDRASAAERHSTPEFGALQIGKVAYHPKQRHIGFYIDFHLFTIQ